MGAFICTISDRDWEKARSLGVYGNRRFKEGTGKELGDVQVLSIIRDLISMKEGDLIFFHVRGKQTIHGIYEARSEPFFDETPIWNDPVEVFPFRFLFRPHPNYQYLADYDANIDVHSLYEYIDTGKIKSLVTLENEMNIEARSVRKILKEDAQIIIGLLHRDFKLRRSNKKIDFNPYRPNPAFITPLRDKIYKVGNIENAVKAVIMHELSHNPSFVRLLFNDERIDIDEIDFVNEFFIAQTTRKSIDIYCKCVGKHILIEAKTRRVDPSALKQALYYRDLLTQREWIDKKKEKIEIVMIGRTINSDVINAVSELKKIGNSIRLLKYLPSNNGKWANFQYVSG